MKINMINLFRNIIVFFVLIILYACNTPHGLIKTPLLEFERQSYPSLGVSILLPRESENKYARLVPHLSESEFYQKNCDCRASLFISMHPYWFGTALAEPQYILGFSFHRLSPVAFEKFKANDHFINIWIRFNGKSNFATVIETIKYKESISNREFICFHKDVVLPDGDVLVCIADLERIFEKNRNEIDDIKAIKQILNSVKPL